MTTTTPLAERIEQAAQRVEATIHKINNHWWNKRVRPEAPDLRILIDAIRSRSQDNGHAD